MSRDQLFSAELERTIGSSENIGIELTSAKTMPVLTTCDIDSRPSGKVDL